MSQRSGQSEPAVAVALQYAHGKDATPRVTAKGKGPIAEQILAIAAERGIPVREDAELATLLEAVELDSPIPVEAFQAVAEILAHIYRANAKLKGGAS